MPSVTRPGASSMVWYQPMGAAMLKGSDPLMDVDGAAAALECGFVSKGSDPFRLAAMGATTSPAQAVAANPVWYHTIELGPGAVTSGQIDMRPVAPKILPADLSGRRALDVGTFDGFWAFEMERRGAETVAIDVPSLESAEWPPLNRARAEAQAREWGVELG